VNRVVVTGIGVISPLGNSPGEILKAITEGTPGLISYPFSWRGETYNLPVGISRLPEGILSPHDLRRYDRVVQLGLSAAYLSYEDAGKPTAKPERMGVFMGVGFGGISTLLEQEETLRERGAHRVSPYLIPAIIPNTLAGRVAEIFHCEGANLTISNACAASAVAIGEGFRRIRSGELEVALCGGAEAPITPLALAGFFSMRALATTPQGCQPFSRTRNGFALAEGAAVLVLEDYERAQARATKIYAEILGYACNADAYHITDPDPEGKGAERVVRSALKDAGIRPEDVDYINAHATGTPRGDSAEAQMILRVFSRGTPPWVSSTKGMTGHLLGGAGALEAVISLIALRSGILPPNLPCDDPEFPLRLVLERGKQIPLQIVLSTSFGFGGVNAALIFSRPDLPIEHHETGGFLTPGGYNINL
jgi:3-oxoacyl-[acyl-carrier-protein] synthase II